MALSRALAASGAHAAAQPGGCEQQQRAWRPPCTAAARRPCRRQRPCVSSSAALVPSLRTAGLAAALATRCSLHTGAAACGPVSSKPALGVPSTLPEVPPRAAAAADRARATGLHRDLPCLSSINDPSNYGLAASPQGSGQGDFWWLSLTASSLSNPKEHSALPCGGAPSTLPPQVRVAPRRLLPSLPAAACARILTSRPACCALLSRQGFKTASWRPTHQRKAAAAFRSSMADPAAPLADPEQRSGEGQRQGQAQGQAFQSSMSEPRYEAAAAGGR